MNKTTIVVHMGVKRVAHNPDICNVHNNPNICNINIMWSDDIPKIEKIYLHCPFVSDLQGMLNYVIVL